MKKACLILSVLLLPGVAFAGILGWGGKAPVKGKVRTVKIYRILLSDSAKCCANPEQILYFDTGRRKIAEDVFIMGSKSNISYEYDTLNRLKKETSTSWETYYYYNDSVNQKQLIMKIRYPRGSTRLMEKMLYSYDGDNLTQFKSYNEYNENYTCTITKDADGNMTETYRDTSGKITNKNETRYYTDGSIAMMNELSMFDGDNTKYYKIEQYTYDRYDKQGNWLWCKVIGSFNSKPEYWLFVREIEYY